MNLRHLGESSSKEGDSPLSIASSDIVKTNRNLSESSPRFIIKRIDDGDDSNNALNTKN